MKVSIALSLNIYETLTYEYKGEIKDLYIGLRVIVPVGNLIRAGWVMSLESDYTGRTRNIIGIVQSNWKPNKNTLCFIKKTSELYLMSSGTLLDYCLLPGQKAIKDIYINFEDKLKSLSKFTTKELLQKSKLSPIMLHYKKEIVYKEINNDKELDFKEHFLNGKNRFDEYKSIIDKTLKESKTVLIIVPDKLSIEYFKKIFPDIDIYNSTQKKAIKDNIYEKYYNGGTGVLIGGLSALFLQINNLSCVIYEKGNTIYSNRGVFNGEKDYKILALKKAEANKCPVYIGTPSIEIKDYKDNQSSLNFIKKNKAKINVIRVKKKKKDLFSDIIQLTKIYFSDNKKTLILLNKKQSKSILYCEKCKKAIKCNNCNKYIQITGKLSSKCPHCNHNILTNCSVCNKPLEILKDVSMDSILKVLKDNVTDTGILNISAEDTKDIKALEENIKASKIIISTPFIIGPYFKDIFDAVIYYKPESVFDMDSYKTAENIFSILSEIKNIIKPEGNIDIFSVYHFHYVFKLINEEEEYLSRELKYRQWFMLPPFYSIYEITIKEKTIRELGKTMREIYIKEFQTLNIKEISILSRKKSRGTFKGVIKAHLASKELINSGILSKRNISAKLIHI